MPKEMQDDVWKTESEWFRPWFNRPAYHVLYGHRSEQEAFDLVHRLVEGGHLGPTGKVLDAGCGAGRHARALASKAWKVSAFDLSEASIASAQLKSDGQVQFQVLDLRELERQTDWTGHFDVVTNFFTSLGYFSTTEEHDSVIRGFATALKPGGLLLLDYLNVESCGRDLSRSNRWNAKALCSRFTVASRAGGLKNPFNSNGRGSPSTMWNAFRPFTSRISSEF